MKRVVLMLSFIAFSVIVFFLLQVKSSTPIYLIKVTNIRNVVYATFFVIMFNGYKLGAYCNVVKKASVIFCVSYAIVYSYPWWPEKWKLPVCNGLSPVDITLYFYFMFWGLACIPLTIYTLICYKRSLE